jgi:predicted glycosyltransferase
LFIVDKEPLGLKKEVLPTLEWIRRCLPGARTILGLRDIMDDATVVKKDWEEKGIYESLDRLYTEIWIYGIRDFYDPVREYGIPESISSKVRFTGYIPRRVPNPEAVLKFRRELKVSDDEKLVVVTTGGGGDGYPVMDTYLKMLETGKGAAAFKSVLINGPFMPKKQRADVGRRARHLGVRAYPFFRQMEKIFAAADVVVCMGGYNTLCEILSQKTTSLIIPRETPRREQLLRAQAFRAHGLADYIPWADFNPERLQEGIDRLLRHPEPFREAMSRFRFTGVETMCHRLSGFRE